MSSALDRFMSKVKINSSSGCWEWTASIRRKDGYANFKLNPNKTVLGHRFAYVTLKGDIPHGLVLDHLCHNRCCVNPAHLEPVSVRVNNLRGVSFCAINARKEYCKAGHLYAGKNLYIHHGKRYCRKCGLVAQYKSIERRKLRSASISSDAAL